MKYVKITVELTVKATDEEDVRSELSEAIDLIETDHIVFEDSIESEEVNEPGNAAELDMDYEEDDDGEAATTDNDDSARTGTGKGPAPGTSPKRSVQTKPRSSSKGRPNLS